MKLRTVALVAEIVSAIAVTVSLIFVGMQIQENTTASEAATFQASVTHDIDILTSAARSPDTAAIFHAFRDHPETLSGNGPSGRNFSGAFLAYAREMRAHVDGAN